MPSGKPKKIISFEMNGTHQLFYAEDINLLGNGINTIK
jgi:hypothetical protein